MIEKAIYNILSTAANMTGINISFGIIPPITQTTGSNIPKSYVVFYRNTTTPHDTKTGRSTLDTAVIQINCFDVSAESVADLAEKVRGNLDRVSGTFNGIKVQSIQFTNEVSLFEFNESYNTKGLFQYSLYFDCRVEPVYQ